VGREADQAHRRQEGMCGRCAEARHYHASDVGRAARVLHRDLAGILEESLVLGADREYRKDWQVELEGQLDFNLLDR
jgi:hypothetical protein